VRWKNLAIVGLLALAAYWPSLKTGFIWDDHFLIEGNPSIKTWEWRTVLQDFSTGIFRDPASLDFYRPLLSFVNRINYSVSGNNPLGYHVLNLFLHATNAMLVASLVEALGFSSSIAFLVAALFAVHPVIVQNLIMVVGRDELMSFGFLLGAMLFLVRPVRPAMVGGLLLYLMALLSKESAIVLVVLLPLLFWARRQWTGAGTRILSVAMITTLYLGWHHYLMGRILPPLPWKLIGLFLVEGFPQVICHYIGLAFWPWDLYTDRILDPPGPNWFLYLGGVLLWFGALLRKRNRLAWILSLWFAISLLPKMALTISNSYLHDHWLYPILWIVLIPPALFIGKGWSSGHSTVKILSRVGFVTIVVF